MKQKQPKNKKVKPNKLICSVRYLEYGQYKKLLGVIDDFNHKLLIRLAFESACRVTEITNLKLKDLDFKNSQIHVQSELTKTGVGGWIEISEDLMNEIKAWLAARKRIGLRSGEIINPQEYLFQSRQSRFIEKNGKKLKVRKYTRQRFNQIFNKYVKKAGLNSQKRNLAGESTAQYTFHSLRHSCIMHMIHDLRLPLDIVRAKSRHASLTGLSHYTKPSNMLVRKEIRNARKEFTETSE